MTNPVDITQRLVRCKTETPNEGGAQVFLEGMLSAAGFKCRRVDRNGTPNLFARWGEKGHPRTFGFNGHTDVVPTGDPALWTHPPFSGVIDGEWLYGRGATDMKSGVAAFVAAAIDFVTNTPPDGSIIFMITGDEEGVATDGTVALLDWMQEHDETVDVCIVGEPTSNEMLGDMIKNGRRGSLNVKFVAKGVEGHAAYPKRAKNPVEAMVELLHRFKVEPLDEGTANFDPSTLTLTMFDVGNTTTNVIPAEAVAGFNIRFNDTHTGDSLSDWILKVAAEVAKETGVDIAVEIKVSGESFITDPGEFTDIIVNAISDVVDGQKPTLSTSGGTSDARFMKGLWSAVEVGLVGHRMHAVDERVLVEDIMKLSSIYRRILAGYFEQH